MLLRLRLFLLKIFLSLVLAGFVNDVSMLQLSGKAFPDAVPVFLPQCRLLLLFRLGQTLRLGFPVVR